MAAVGWLRQQVSAAQNLVESPWGRQQKVGQRLIDDTPPTTASNDTYRSLTNSLSLHDQQNSDLKDDTQIFTNIADRTLVPSVQMSDAFESPQPSENNVKSEQTALESQRNPKSDSE